LIPVGEQRETDERGADVPDHDGAAPGGRVAAAVGQGDEEVQGDPGQEGDAQPHRGVGQERGATGQCLVLGGGEGPRGGAADHGTGSDDVRQVLGSGPAHREDDGSGGPQRHHRGPHDLDHEGMIGHGDNKTEAGQDRRQHGSHDDDDRRPGCRRGGQPDRAGRRRLLGTRIAVE